MKKIFLLFLFLFLNFLSIQVNAQIVMQRIGGDIVDENNISIPVNIQFVSDDDYSKITFKALDNYIINLERPEFKIPISKMELNIDSDIFNILPNQEMVLFQNLDSLNSSKLCTFRTKEIKFLPAGNYVTKIQFNRISKNNNDSEIFNLFFRVPLRQNISSNSKTVDIRVKSDNVFQKNIPIINESNTYLIIDSNTDWKLSLDTSSFSKTKQEYYLNILNSDKDISACLEPIKLNEPKKIVIARGKIMSDNATFLNNSKKYLNLRFLMKNENEEFIEAGDINHQITYILEEDL